MTKRQREVFLLALFSDLMATHPQWHIDNHSKIEWSGQPRSIWPEADLSINMPGRRFIVEYDEDSDPDRSLIKYWPILAQINQTPVTTIEVLKRGQTIGQGYAVLAKWIGAKLMELYPQFVYHFIERSNKSSRETAAELARIIQNGTSEAGT